MPNITPEIFKAYDIRGTYPDQFNEEAAYHIARAFAQALKGKTAVVGHDMRESWKTLVPAVIKGLNDSGVDVWDIGLASTPLFYYSVNALGGDIGLQLTASHNPAKYNGFKPTGPQAIPSISFVSNQEICRLANAAEFDTPEQPGKVLGQRDLLDDYIEAVIEAAGVDDFSGLKLVIDTGNGMGGHVVPKLTRRLGADVVPLYWELDGSFPNHEANPLDESTMEDLKKKVVEVGADLGVAYDGDADRVRFVDEKGESVPGDMITALLARQILRHQPGEKILYDLRSSRAVREEIEKAGGEPVMCRVGHGLIKRQMREEGGIFAGELSCHYYFRSFYITDNGDLAMLHLVGLLKETGSRLSELWRPIKRYFHSGEINSEVEDVPGKLKELEDLYGPQGRSVLHLDGLTVEFEDWWFNVRPSNTEPLLRLTLEAPTEEQMAARRDEVLQVIRS